MSTLSYIIYKLGSPLSSPSYPPRMQRYLRFNGSTHDASSRINDLFVISSWTRFYSSSAPTLDFPPFDDHFLTGKAILPLHAFYDRDESLRTCYFPLGILYFCEIVTCYLSFLTYRVKTIYNILPNKI